MAHNGGKPADIRLLQFKVPGLPDLALAVALQEVLEVTKPGSITGIPFAPHFVTGLRQWRGNAIAVIDLADILCKDALPRPYREAEMHYLVARIIIGDKLDAVAWPISSRAGMLSVPSQAPQATLSTDLLPQAIYAAFTVSNVPFVLLNLAGIAKCVVIPPKAVSSPALSR